MKKNSLQIVVSGLVGAAIGALIAMWPASGRAQSAAISRPDRLVRELYVSGWDSRAAVAETEERLTSLPGVVFARGSLRDGKVVMQFRTEAAADEALVNAVEGAGFEVVGVGVIE